MKILIAEDENVSRRILQHNLENWGYEVEACEDGRKDLQKFRKQHFPVIITDWMMPEMSGIELVEHVRALQGEDYSYIIMLTSRSDKHDFMVGMEAGADDFVAKPFDKDELRLRLQAARRALELEHRLAAQNRDLQAANLRMREDLKAAARIQASLLPTAPPRLKNINIEWQFEPCDELAGDSLNAFNLDEDHVGFYLLDVSGHGVPAALLAVTIHRMLSPVMDDSSIIKRRQVEKPYYKITPPVEVAHQLNNRFQIDPENSQYFTLIYGILNKRTYEFQYVSAGHPELIHMRADGTTVAVEANDVPIGFLEDHQFEEQIVQLSPGDRLYLHSDGISEATDCQGHLFGLERMVSTLTESRGDSLGKSIELLVRRAREWTSSGTVDDDISLLGVELL